MSVTVKDVAEAAGVSISAVSRYLNGGSVSREKQEQIREAMEATGYVGGRQSRRKRRSNRGKIGVIVPNIESQSAAQVVKGISQVLEEEGYLLILGHTDNNPKREPVYLEQMARDGVAGVILLGTFYTPDHARVFRDFSLPLVITGQNYTEVNCVFHDDFSAARDLADRMLLAGYRRIAYLGVSKYDFAVGADRMRGVEYALQEAGCLDKNLILTDCDFNVESGQERVRELVSREKTLEGLICATDMIAIGAMIGLKEMGYHLPEDLAVAGFGDYWAGRLIKPSLSTVRLFHRDAGIQAATMLIQEVGRQEEAPVKSIRLGYELHLRESFAGEVCR